MQLVQVSQASCEKVGLCVDQLSVEGGQFLVGVDRVEGKGAIVCLWVPSGLTPECLTCDGTSLGFATR